MNYHQAKQCLREIFRVLAELGEQWNCVAVYRDGDDVKAVLERRA